MHGRSTYMARGGILTALGFILVYGSSIIPTSRFTLLAIASIIVPIAVLTTNIPTSIGVYFATSILTFLFLGLRGSTVLYILLFGIYGLIKLFIEKLKNLPLEIILKLCYFNIILVIIYFLLGAITNISGINLPDIPYIIPIAIIALQFVFLIYDYVLSQGISYFLKRLYKRL